MWLSKDQGVTWEVTEGSINGIHASIVELKDGRIMALGRGGNINHHLPMSISADYGKTWTAMATELPPITYTQRFSMTRLAEGHLALATFLPDVAKLGPQRSTDRELAKLCICISYDDGKTWPTRRILTDERGDHGLTGMSYGRVYMGYGAGEPTAYVTVTQARNGVIHVVSSMNHYAFNLKWAESGPAHPDPMPQPKTLPARSALTFVLTPEQMKPYHVARTLWSNERTGAMEALDAEKGFSAEAEVTLGKGEHDHFILRAFVRSGCTMCNRYWMRVTARATSFWYAGEWQTLPDAVEMGNHGVYRMAVRDDTCVQIYRDGRLLATFPPSYEIGFALPTRGNWMEWEMNMEGTEIAASSVSYDLSGPFQSVSTK